MRLCLTAHLRKVILEHFEVICRSVVTTYPLAHDITFLWLALAVNETHQITINVRDKILSMITAQLA